MSEAMRNIVRKRLLADMLAKTPGSTHKVLVLDDVRGPRAACAARGADCPRR